VTEEWEDPVPELEPTDCTGAEECAAPWHWHGCLEDAGACTEPSCHVISADNPSAGVFTSPARPTP
jgi:hypothetical protein